MEINMENVNTNVNECKNTSVNECENICVNNGINKNEDYIVKATAASGMIRAFAATTKNTVETAREKHNTSPIVTAALGRLMTAALMMSSDLKGDDELLTLKIGCSGPIQGMVVTSDNGGNVKGYAFVPDVMLPPNESGKLDVGGALELGVLSVIRDEGLKDPYVGQTQLISGEIAEDLTYYFATSEQVPSSVALGVLMNRENTVREAGGFIIQLMPGASEEIAEKLEKKLAGLDSMTSMLDKGMTPEDILREILGEYDLIINESSPCRFFCGCTKDRVEKALISLGKKEIEDIISAGETIEMSCHFCGSKYNFTIDELKTILEKAK